MYKYELYCGVGLYPYKNLEDIAMFAEQRLNIANFIFEQAALLNLNVTITDIVGSWTDKQNNLSIEEGVLITILGDKKSKIFVKELACIYKQKYNQESVLFTETEVNYEFI